MENFRNSGLSFGQLPNDVQDFIEEATDRREGTFDELKIEAVICDVTGDFRGYRAVYYKDVQTWKEVVDVIEIEAEEG